MASSDFSPQESGRQPPASSQGVSPPKQVTDPALLESVLQQTLSICSSDEPLDPGSRRALEEVAARHRGEPFSVEPVAVELVAAVLHSQGKASSNSADAWRSVAFQVARTLCEDPTSRGRLETFWGRLCEG